MYATLHQKITHKQPSVRVSLRYHSYLSMFEMGHIRVHGVTLQAVLLC